jgi:hypothetical protein
MLLVVCVDDERSSAVTREAKEDNVAGTPVLLPKNSTEIVESKVSDEVLNRLFSLPTDLVDDCG